MSSFIPIAQNSSFFSEKKIKKLNLNSHDIKCAPNPLIKNFFSNLGYKNASNDIVWEKPIVQKKIVHFILYSWKIRFTSSILSKTQPRLYPNISFMIPFSKDCIF